MNQLPPGTLIRAYLSKDSFDQVVAFYKGLGGKEYTSPQQPTADKLPDGRGVQKAFVILDQARDPVISKSWVRIQHPFVAPVSHAGGPPQYRDVQDVTQIVLTEKVAVPEKSTEQKTRHPTVPRPR